MGTVRSKLIAGLLGVLAGASFLALAQVPGPVNLQGSGGNTIAQIDIPQLGTGGTITSQGSYTVHTFTANGTFTPPAGLTQFDVLIVAGGGGGGGFIYGGGGGGAGGLRWLTNQANGSPSYAVVIGAGGTAGPATDTADGGNGGNSSFGALVATGGGGGQRGNRGNDATTGGNGGSGGGGGSRDANNSPHAGGTGTVGEGNNGGAGTASNTDDNNRGGGGGGAGAVGGTGTGGIGGAGGAGGVGQDFSAIFGTGVGQNGWFAGGGGGGKRQNGVNSAGGTGGGGAGSASTVGTAGTANTGGGGGASGGAGGAAGGAGGSGIVIVRYIAPAISYMVHTFTAGGTFTPPAGVTSVEVLAVGGGGGGGRGSASSSGGGGGGGAVVFNSAVAVTPLSGVIVTVGTGGAGATIDNNAGGAGVGSVFNAVSAVTATGGGGGGAGNGVGQNGASGGGGGANDATNRAGGTASAGFAGGSGFGDAATANIRAGGGGGGAGAIGSNGASTVGGAGGVGISNNSSGSSLFYGGGGGGASATGGSGGSGVGASGASGAGAPGTATANRGGGGGGTRDANASSGAAGVVIVRYRPPSLTITQQASTAVVSNYAFLQQPIVRLLSATGAPISGVNITAAIETGTGTLGGTTTVATDINGYATFTNLQLVGAPGTFRLNFTATGSTQKVITNNITLEAYSFRILHDGAGNVCTAETVTIEVRTTSGILVTNYTGTITLSTSTVTGSWAVSSVAGTLTPGAGNGSATYTFVTGDAGDVALSLFHPGTGVVDINIVSGLIVENPSFDPALTIIACSDSPTLLAQQCYNTNTGNISINASGTNVNRLLIAAVSRAGDLGITAPATATFTFNGVAMTQVGATLFQNSTGGSNSDAMTQLYAMYDSAMPGAAGSYTANFTAAGTTRVCLFYYEDMMQAAPAGAAVAGTGATGNSTTISTNVTTAGANSLVLSAVTAWNAVTYTGATAPLTTRLQSVNGASSTFAVSSGVIANASTITATETSGANTTTRAHIAAAFRPAARALNHFLISHNGSGGTCSENAVTITAVDQYGSPLTTYTGTVTLSTSSLLGDWSAGTGLGTMTNGAANDGAATYQFAAGDNGVAVLSYSNTNASTVNFNVSDGSIVESPFFDGNMTIGACGFRITHAGSGSVCALTAVTITAVDAAGNTLSFYNGTVNISTSLVPGPGSGGGGWTATDAFGTLTDTNPADGIATYQFSASDNGDVVLYYSRTSTGTININLSATAMVEDPTYDPNLVMGACYFRITHSGNGDICTPEAVAITVVNASGVTQADYTGTVTISTSTTTGTWSAAMSALGTFNDLGSGNATYTFHDDDNGVVNLSLVHSTPSASVNINLTSGSFQEDPAYDPLLAVAACTFRVSFSSPNAMACEATTMTLEVYDGSAALATGFTGTVTLTTDTAHGTWLSTTGLGSLVDASPNNGTGTYTFVSGDFGSVDIVFTDTTVETVNVNAVSGSMTIDSGFDPDLNVTACIPTVSDWACYQNQSQASAIDLLPESQTLGSRMVLMYIGSRGTTAATGATINGVAMTQLRTEIANFGQGTTVEVYGILDVNLPDVAGAYAAAHTSTANTTMCLVSIWGVEQGFPLTDSPATDGQLNGSNSTTDPISTGITTLQNNSIVVSVVAGSTANSTYTSTLLNEMWDDGNSDPANTHWAGHYGQQPAVSAVTVTETSSASPARQAHIVLTLAPSVLGDPAAAGYEPINLFQTYAGSIGYRAIGNSLRTSSNATLPCAMQATSTGSTATLTLPAGSTVTQAYLYWAGSGAQGDIDSQVRFGVDGMLPERPLVTALETFFIEPNQVYNPSYPVVPESFFAGYKDVTGSISNATSTTYRFSDLTVRTDGDWALYDTCLAGWALVVVYENPGEDLNVINLFHGFQPLWHSAVTLTAANFRMAPPDGLTLPHAQVTHITFEGDADITGANEELELQNDPATQTFTIMTNPLNAADNQYNDTVSYPTYDGSFNFTGYTGLSTSYGADVDTYFVQGDTIGELLYPFGQIEAEQIQTRHSADQDIVLLAAEVISVTNAPIADLEVFVDDAGTFRADSSASASYTYEVTNNGNGSTSGGFASGDVILTGNMPLGITIDSITSAGGWDCSLATLSAFTCVFDIAADWTMLLGAATAGELAKDESLPIVTVTVDIANETSFPLLDNEVITVARLAHVGSYATCPVAAAGVQPDPNPATGCSKAPQFDNINDLDNFLIDIDDLSEKSGTNNNVHHNTGNVRGVETDLGIVKALSGVLETNTPATYTLTVTNYGPDATTKTITVTDTLPSGLVPSSASGTDWICGIASQTVTCTRSIALGVGATAPTIAIGTANIVAPAIEGAFVSNTGTVATGTYNFDTVAGNNSEGDITQVAGPLADGDESFLISANESSTLGGVAFDDGDLVLYDPVTDTSELFLDEDAIPGTTNLGNLNALHALPNGHLILSTDLDGATINSVAFNAEDLVLYDPLLGTATLIFDGSTVFNSDTADIDAVHVNYNDSYDSEAWTLVISTADTATITDVGAMPGDLTFQDNDLVQYDMATNEAVLLVDGGDTDVFGAATGDIGALYIRYLDADQLVLGTSDASAVIGPTGAQTTIEGTELAELDLNGPGIASSLLCDSDAPCVGMYPADFTPVSATRRLDATHVIENGYFGHFAIASAGGDTCSATAITISKHAALGHGVETHYVGSVLISNNLGTGTWAKDVTANGTLTNLGGGMARYTFVSLDAGEVILYITGTVSTNSFNVDVTNGIGSENAPTEDANIVISDQITNLTYLDQFSLAAYNNNDGVAGFASVWSETNDDGNAATGKIRIVTDTDELRFNNLGGGVPGIQREIDFSTYSVDLPPTLSFNWRIAGSPTGTFVAEARGNDMDSWTTLQSFTGSSGSGSASIAFTQAPFNLVVSATTQIRFRIASGYSSNASEFIYIDNVQVSTETNDCGVGDTVDHYEITHNGSMISCLAEMITITPHSLSELVVDPGLGVTLTLNTDTNKGFWGPPINGSGAFNAPLSGNGQATYVYQVGEEELTFPFYYTELTGDTETISFAVSDSTVPSKVNALDESPTMLVSRAGLRFYNVTDDSETLPNLVAGMPSTLLPADVLRVHAVRTSDDDPAVCESLFPDNTDVTVGLAFECTNPSACSAGPINVEVTNNGNTVAVAPVNSNSGAGVSGGYVDMPLRFIDYGTYNGAEIALNYADVGEMQMHGRYQLVVQDNAGGNYNSGDYLEGISNLFVVRPFGLSIDFSLDRITNYDETLDDWSAVESYATTASDPDAFIGAGVNFPATVTAVAWEAGDDLDNDGNPDPEARLFDNARTPKFGHELDPADSLVTFTGVHVLPTIGSGGVAGTLATDVPYDDFANGEATHNMSYSEVGTIDIVATLDTGNYLGSGGPVTGTAYDVGRFVPDHFGVNLSAFTERPAFAPTSATFTYLGEEFGVSFTLTARNEQGNATQNYFGDFARIRTTTNPVSFYAIDDVTGAPDVNYTLFGANTTLCNGVDNTSQRLCQSASNGFDFTSDWMGGVRVYSGRLIFSRQASQAAEGPYNDLLIGIAVSDSDAVTDAINAAPNKIELDDSNDDVTDTEYNLLKSHVFRFGRIRLQNAYGSEIPEVDDMGDPTGEDLELRLVAEYWDGTEFIVHEDDVATSYASTGLGFVAGSYTDNLGAGEAIITSGLSGIIYQGESLGANVTDAPLFLQAPGVGNEGSALIDIDLDALGLRFLKYDWRSDGELEDIISGGANAGVDNPRALIEFGRFRGNDRIINWQEIFE